VLLRLLAGSPPTACRELANQGLVGRILHRQSLAAVDPTAGDIGPTLGEEVRRGHAEWNE
jgi:hypothetical protein